MWPGKGWVGESVSPGTPPCGTARSSTGYSGCPVSRSSRKIMPILVDCASASRPPPTPSIRKLARDLQISVITSKRAYEELEREGFINTVGGKGTFVAAQNPEFLREKRMKAVEEKLAEAVEQARLLNVDSEQLAEMLRLLYAEEE